MADAVRRLGAAGEPPPPVQGVRVAGPGACAVTTYGALVHRVGDDAARHALLRTRRNRPVTVDLGIWSRRDERNPAWRVQWIGPRTADVLATAAAHGLRPGERRSCDDPAIERLRDALDAVADVRAAAANYAEPHRLAEHLEREIVPSHDAVVDLVRRQVSDMRDDRTGSGPTAYRASLFLLARCVADVADVLAVSGLRLPDRL
ncbi:MAG: hypothetical protein J2P24_21040 [Streptosporangiales bacterium]|nr:hypothetical protein [Streptosporangiales bacterium]